MIQRFVKRFNSPKMYGSVNVTNPAFKTTIFKEKQAWHDCQIWLMTILVGCNIAITSSALLCFIANMEIRMSGNITL